MMKRIAQSTVTTAAIGAAQGQAQAPGAYARPASPRGKTAARIALFLLAGAAAYGPNLTHAAPQATRMAQAGPAAAGQSSGSTGGGQWKHPESGATSPAGSSAVGPGEGQGQARDATPPSGSAPGKRSGNDTQAPSSKGTVGKSDSAKGSAANSDKGPGHRGADTKAGH
jgi:hypothetical protein